MKMRSKQRLGTIVQAVITVCMVAITLWHAGALFLGVVRDEAWVMNEGKALVTVGILCMSIVATSACWYFLRSSIKLDLARGTWRRGGEG